MVTRGHAVALGLHRVEAVLVVDLALVEEPNAVRSKRHPATIGIRVDGPEGVHGTVGNAVAERVGHRIQRRVEAHEPVDERLVTQLGATRVGVAADGMSAGGEHGHEDQGDQDAHDG